MDAFSIWVKMDVNDLPVQAAKIFSECQGHPFEISLIGSLLRERSNRWHHYYELLRERKLTEIQKKTSYRFKDFVAAAGLSLDHLSAELSEQFRSLGVFQRGAEIPLKALMVYWDKTDIAVEDIMDVFVKRSLAENQSHGALTPSGELFRVHVLLQETVKLLNGPEQQKNLHKQLIGRYLAKADGQWDRLALDGYIYGHLAYHLYRSGDENAPWEIFLNLSFMAKKLLMCGPVQTLTNFQRYESFIRKKGAIAFNDFQAFIRRNIHSLAERYRSGSTCDSIFSLALEEPPTSVVYQQADAFNEVLRFSVPRVVENGNHSVNDQPTMSLRCSSATVNQAVWLNGGNSSAFASVCADGTLRVHSASTGREFTKIQMDQAGECISVSPDSTLALVSCGADLIVCNLPDLASCMDQDGFSVSSISGEEYHRTPSPLLNAWPERHSQRRNYPLGGMADGPRSGRRYRWCQISHDGRKAVSGDTEGNVLIWDLSNDQAKPDVINGHSSVVCCCVFSSKDDLIVSVGDDGIGNVYKTNNRQRVFTFALQGQCQIAQCCWIDAGPFTACILGISFAQIAVWSARDGTVRMEWCAPLKVACVDVSKCGGYIASGLIDGSIMVWKLLPNESPQLFSTFSSTSKVPANSVRFRDGGRLLVARQNGFIEIWAAEVAQE